MADTVAILEDHPGRVAAMAVVLREVLPQFRMEFFASAPQMIAWLRGHSTDPVLISLDHDLDSVVPRALQPADPGEGRDVADYLSALPPVCPVIVHSSNTHAAAGIRRVLDQGGWPTASVAPINDLAWVQEDWKVCIRVMQREGWIFP